MKTVIFTAIYGDYDTPQIPKLTPPARNDVDFFMFTNDKDLKPPHPWMKCLYDPGYKDPLMNAKRVKVMSHEVIGGYDRSLWVDGNYELHGDPIRRVFPFINPQRELVLVRHYCRSCLFDEAEVCINQKLDDPKLISKTVRQYLKLGITRPTGLYFGSFIGRQRSENIKRFNMLWWHLIENGTNRDQIHLPIAVKLSGIGCMKMPSNTFGKLFVPKEHKKERKISYET